MKINIEDYLIKSKEKVEDLTAGNFITASVLLEYLFCPRFIYFMNCLLIPQREEKRYKVIKGREVHDKKAKININYKREKINCVKKEINVYMSSKDYCIHGEVDEILTLADGTMAPLDYKFAEYKDFIYRTHRYQSIFYAFLIKETYKKEVKRGFICYVRSNNILKEVKIEEKDFADLKNIIEEIKQIVIKGYFPAPTKSKQKCLDCTYKNICC